jgi:hypothetical protein
MERHSSGRRCNAGVTAANGESVPEAQTIAVGVTSGEAQPTAGFVPFNRNELSRDLRVASHFTRVVAVYSLEAPSARDSTVESFAL